MNSEITSDCAWIRDVPKSRVIAATTWRRVATAESRGGISWGCGENLAMTAGYSGRAFASEG
jgi:hypothetical protein